jgi:hypothetical protein
MKLSLAGSSAVAALNPSLILSNVRVEVCLHASIWKFGKLERKSGPLSAFRVTTYCTVSLLRTSLLTHRNSQVQFSLNSGKCTTTKDHEWHGMVIRELTTDTLVGESKSQNCS